MGKLLTGQDGLGPVKALKSLETLQQGWGCDRSQAALAAPKEPTESVECLLAQARGGTTMPTPQACRLQQFIEDWSALRKTPNPSRSCQRGHCQLAPQVPALLLPNQAQDHSGSQTPPLTTQGG